MLSKSCEHLQQVLFCFRYLTSLVSQLLTASLDMEDGECFNQLFVSLYKSQLLTADVLVKVSCLLPCSLRLRDVSLV